MQISKKCFPVLLSILLLFYGCGKNIILGSKQELPVIKAPPFNGYICGYEQSKTFLQMPIFILTSESLTINDIKRITLSGNDIDFQCNDYRMSSFTESKLAEYKFSTLSFRTLLSEVGEYSVSELKIEFTDGTIQVIDLGEIYFDIRTEQESDSDGLAMRRFQINQISPSSLRISYSNQTTQPITITGFSYPDNLFSTMKIEKYTDFQLSLKEDDLTVMPNSEKTFVVSFEYTSDFSDGMQAFFYFLPFVEYEINNKPQIMPAQTQPTVVQRPFSEEVIREIVH